VLPFKLVSPILRGAESAPQAVGERIEIPSEVSTRAVDGTPDLSVEVLDRLDLSTVDPKDHRYV
jgi:hypothetical protein